MSRKLYRLVFTDGSGDVEDASFDVLNTMRQSKPGVITAYDVKVNVMKGTELLQEFDWADDADPVCQSFQEIAAQEARDQYFVQTVKTISNPQPEGLN
jgi:hypothetical protein